MEDEKEVIEKAEAFVHSVMEGCPDELRDVDVITLCGFLMVSYAADQDHASRFMIHLLTDLREYYEKLERGELNGPVH